MDHGQLGLTLIIEHIILRDTRVEMSIREAEKLITYLNDASDLLSTRVDELKYMVSFFPTEAQIYGKSFFY